MLAQNGNNVSGFSLKPEIDSLFYKENIASYLQNDIRGDIRDLSALKQTIFKLKPDVVIHLAAQALVSESFKNPMDTFTSNVLGTANLLESVISSNSVRTCVIITTDKVYSNDNSPKQGFVENSPLGISDPYSSSKALADLWTQTFVRLHPDAKIFIARAGNVIGAGDSTKGRLIPDLREAWTSKTKAIIRNPYAIRPWQHVSDCITGYQLLVEKSDLLENGSSWNFSPNLEEHLSVKNVVELASNIWPSKAEWVIDSVKKYPETDKLIINSSKARNFLNWSPKMGIQASLKEALLN